MFWDKVRLSGNQYIFWEDILARSPRSLQSQDVIQIWNNKSLIELALNRGHSIILSLGWYLDRQVPVTGETRTLTKNYDQCSQTLYHVS